MSASAFSSPPRQMVKLCALMFAQPKFPYLIFGKLILHITHIYVNSHLCASRWLFIYFLRYLFMLCAFCTAVSYTRVSCVCVCVFMCIMGREHIMPPPHHTAAFTHSISSNRSILYSTSRILSLEYFSAMKRKFPCTFRVLHSSQDVCDGCRLPHTFLQVMISRASEH